MTHRTDISVRILYEWDEASSQTVSFRPAGSIVALIDWTILPLPVDESVPEAMMSVVTQTPVSMGKVAFRLFYKDELADGVTVLPASRGWLGKRAIERVLHTWPADIAIAITPAAAADMFFQDWHLQAQTALVLRTDSLSEKSMDRLRRARDWRDLSFPVDAKLLIAPAVDGEGVLLAAAHAHELEAAVQTIAGKLREAGIAVTVNGPV